MSRKKKSRYPGVFQAGENSWGYVLDLPPVWEEHIDPDTGETTRTRKRRQEKRSGWPAEKAAWEARCERQGQLGQGVIGGTGSRRTVTEHMARYLAGQAINVKPASLHAYTQRSRLYIEPHLGHIPLRDLEPSHIRAWHATLSKPPGKKARPIALQTIADVHGLLSTALEQAVAVDQIIGRNVARLVGPPHVEHHKPLVWTPEQISRFLVAADEDEHAAFWRLALLTQLRPGELAGLIWEDLDLRQGRLTVQRTRTRDEDGHMILGTSPKTPSGYRTIDLPASCVELLRAHRRDQLAARLQYPGRWEDLHLVFPGRTGGVLPNWTISARLSRLIDTINADLPQEEQLPRLTPHGLRHSGATMLRILGEDAKVTAARLGHISVAFTLDVYSHILPGEQQRASDRLERGLNEIAQQRVRDSS